MRARLIVNPSAGADRALTLLPRINDRLRTLITDLDITIATGGQDAIRAATRAAREECDAVYVAGGDGTLNAKYSEWIGAGTTCGHGRRASSAATGPRSRDLRGAS